MSTTREEMKQKMEIKLEKMQFLGIFGILQEAYKNIYTWRALFSQITLFLIFPLTLFFLAYNQISNHMNQNFVLQIIQNKSQKDLPIPVKLSELVRSYELAYILHFVIFHGIFLTIFSIPCTSWVTYVIARTYTEDEVSFKQSSKVVTKFWKPVMITSFNALGFSFTYHSAAACVLLFIFRVIIFRCRFYWHIQASILIVFMTMYMVGSLYLCTIWMLSNAVSMLEESYGVKALMKGQRLLRGKMVAARILLFSQVVVCGLLWGFVGDEVRVFWRFFV